MKKPPVGNVDARIGAQFEFCRAEIVGLVGFLENAEVAETLPVTVARFRAAIRAVQGNRSGRTPMTYDDLRLIMIGTLKVALEILEAE